MQKLIVFSCLIVFSVFSKATADSLKPIKVAIIDTGVDIYHEALSPIIWTNPSEIPGNGIDDDHNGYIDDINGWNFADNNNSTEDHNGHGTHIAGLIKTYGFKNSSETQLQLIPIKYYDQKLSIKEQRSSFVKAIQYAVSLRVNIINISAGGKTDSAEEQKALQQAADQGIIIVASAGNKLKSKSFVNFYPSAYPIKNLLSVAATNSKGVLLSTSNVNLNKKNIRRSGEKLYSSLPGNKYGYKTGSSQAAACLSGQIISQYFQEKISLNKIATQLTTSERIVANSTNNSHEI